MRTDTSPTVQTAMAEAGGEAGGAFRPEAFQAAMAEMPAAVTVVTTPDIDGAPLGATVSAVTTLSLDPAMVLVCLDTRSDAFHTLEPGSPFALHLLSDGQQEIATQLSGRDPGRFAGVEWRTGRSGTPEIAGSAAVVTCEVASRVPGGDDVVVTGRVRKIHNRPGSHPLAYRRRPGSGIQRLRPPVIELARQLHDTVAQRLAVLSYALATGAVDSDEMVSHCRTEVDATLAELRAAIMAVGFESSPGGGQAMVAEVQALRDRFPELEIDMELGDVLDARSGQLVRGFLAEAFRNIRKHASPLSVTVDAGRGAGVTVVTVVNDGVRSISGPSSGVGHRLLAVEAALHGGLAESCAVGADEWRQRLVLPA
jgi:flavin reductase (DIM6/NTAB) family NADH-FMN oxidoreductase RutF